jgi:hypothetical protein
MAGLIAALIYGPFIFLAYMLARWVYRDAESRGKSGWLVILLVLNFPVGLIAWLVFRPAPKPEITGNYLRQS